MGRFRFFLSIPLTALIVNLIHAYYPVKSRTEPCPSTSHSDQDYCHRTKRLVSLNLRTSKWKWWNLLSLMLDGSPKLQILKLTNLYRYCEKGDRIRRNRNTFVWTGYLWERRDEKEVATYILRNTRRLKKATFSTKPNFLNKLEKRREMLDELASVGKASNSCNFVFESM
ncbi:hypothetical protein CARUB_v10018489mg [Capsella rubella]|uniref:FBD domain-containing protein n=1 Tax=Capsella rubella TaxID=81985 RepID=R0FRG4_9BRAS|nr:hypothetical protein CARUB_v10018489mg [Capsella rubella]